MIVPREFQEKCKKKEIKFKKNYIFIINKLFLYISLNPFDLFIF